MNEAGRRSVDENGGIQHQAGHRSAGPAIIAAALAPDPSRRIVIPFVTGVGQRAERGFDFVPALVVLEGTPNRGRDELAPVARVSATVHVPSVTQGGGARGARTDEREYGTLRGRAKSAQLMEYSLRSEEVRRQAIPNRRQETQGGGSNGTEERRGGYQ